jgi:ankyrin repeat protein
LVTNSGSTALSIATRNGHAAIVQLLTAALAAP